MKIFQICSHVKKYTKNLLKKFQEKNKKHKQATDGVYTSRIPLLFPLIEIFPKKENAEKKKRNCEKVILYVLELS